MHFKGMLAKGGSRRCGTCAWFSRPDGIGHGDCTAAVVGDSIVSFARTMMLPTQGQTCKAWNPSGGFISTCRNCRHGHLTKYVPNSEFDQFSCAIHEPFWSDQIGDNNIYDFQEHVNCDTWAYGTPSTSEYQY